MLTDGSFHLGLGLCHTILHSLDLPLGLPELGCRVLKVGLQLSNPILQGLYLVLKVGLECFLALECLLVGFFDLL